MVTLDLAMRVLVPKASECGSPHCNSATAVGGGRPKGDGGGKRVQESLYGFSLEKRFTG